MLSPSFSTWPSKRKNRITLSQLQHVCNKKTHFSWGWGVGDGTMRNDEDAVSISGVLLCCLVHWASNRSCEQWDSKKDTGITWTQTLKWWRNITKLWNLCWTLKLPQSKSTVANQFSAPILVWKEANTFNKRLKYTLAVVTSKLWKYLQGYYQKPTQFWIVLPWVVPEPTW